MPSSACQGNFGQLNKNRNFTVKFMYSQILNKIIFICYSYPFICPPYIYILFIVFFLLFPPFTFFLFPFCLSFIIAFQIVTPLQPAGGGGALPSPGKKDLYTPSLNFINKFFQNYEYRNMYEEKKEFFFNI